MFRKTNSKIRCRGIITMGKLIMEFKGMKLEVSVADEKIEKVYNALPSFLLEKGQQTLSEIRQPKSEDKPIQKPLARESLKYPSRDEIYTFIKSQPNYEFSLPMICNHFLGFSPNSVIGNPERRYYDRMWDKTNRAKKMIVKEENGEWKSKEGEGRETIYWFVKKTDSDDGGTEKQQI